MNNTIVFLQANLMSPGILAREQPPEGAVKMVENLGLLSRVSLAIKGTQKGRINNAMKKLSITSARSDVLQFILTGKRTKNFQVADECEITIKSVLA